jgi:serine/threonine-protein kinase
VLDEETRSFVKRALEAGLVDVAEIKKAVASLIHGQHEQFDSQRIATALVGTGALTHWQASKLLAGKTRGFYLGSYKLLRPLGKGGMGVVFLGEHHVMKRLMALKILPNDALTDARRIERFKEEARASAQLNHPNIVSAFDFAQAGDRFYIVMEYVDGIDLQQAVARDGVMSFAAAIDIMMQASQGLAHAHERSIVHRDIKPSNLLLRTDGVVKISDMGLARIGWSGPAEGEGQRRLLGTADYAAPEQAINSQTSDARADIYSLGCTLYYLLTGQVPFKGSNIAQRLAHHQATPAPDIRHKRPDCPARIAEFALRMMAKRPEDRPASATELIAQLKRLGGNASADVNSSLRRVAPADDTTVDKALFQDTIEDSSLSSDGEVPTVANVEEFDFANLPEIILPTTARPVAPPVNALKVNKSSKPNTQIAYSSPKPSNNSNTKGQSQLVLLGVGLAVAVIALLATLGISVYTLTRPEEKSSPVIRATEEGNKQIVIIRE